MLVVERMRVRCPRLMGLDGGQQSKPSREAEKRLHALMLRPDLEKSSLGLAVFCGQRFGSPSPFSFRMNRLLVAASRQSAADRCSHEMRRSTKTPLRQGSWSRCLPIFRIERFP